MTFEMYLVLGFGAVLLVGVAISGLIRRRKRAPKTHYDVQQQATYDVEGHQEFSRKLREEIDQRADRDSRPWHAR